MFLFVITSKLRISWWLFIYETNIGSKPTILSKKTSSVFASVANDGRIEIWDLAIDPLAPLVTWFDKDPKDTTGQTFLKHAKTVVRFSKAISPVIFTGNVCG